MYGAIGMTTALRFSLWLLVKSDIGNTLCLFQQSVPIFSKEKASAIVAIVVFYKYQSNKRVKNGRVIQRIENWFFTVIIYIWKKA